MKNIYFDHNATTDNVSYINEPALHVPLNPSSVHYFGRQARKIVEDARIKVKNVFKADKEWDLVFTSSGTEANNLALKGGNFDLILTSNIEHPSVLSVVGEGLIEVDKDGIVKLEHIERLLQMSINTKRKLVSVMFANNETGVIQPIKDIADLAHKYNALMHTDAVQAAGKIDINLQELGVDMLTISGHKFGAPYGSGALLFRNKIALSPVILGGGQEYRLRSGTQNVPAIYGLGVTAENLIQRISEMRNKVKKNRDYLEDKLKNLYPKIKIVGENVARLPNTSSIITADIPAHTQVIYYDINNIAVSAGSACSSGKISVPLVHLAMGYDQKDAECAIRISLGLSNQKKEIDYFCDKFVELLQNHNFNLR